MNDLDLDKLEDKARWVVKMGISARWAAEGGVSPDTVLALIERVRAAEKKTAMIGAVAASSIPDATLRDKPLAAVVDLSAKLSEVEAELRDLRAALTELAPAPDEDAKQSLYLAITASATRVSINDLGRITDAVFVWLHNNGWTKPTALAEETP